MHTRNVASELLVCVLCMERSDIYVLAQCVRLANAAYNRILTMY